MFSNPFWSAPKADRMVERGDSVVRLTSNSDCNGSLVNVQAKKAYPANTTPTAETDDSATTDEMEVRECKSSPAYLHASQAALEARQQSDHVVYIQSTFSDLTTITNRSLSTHRVPSSSSNSIRPFKNSSTASLLSSSTASDTTISTLSNSATAFQRSVAENVHSLPPTTSSATTAAVAIHREHPCQQPCEDCADKDEEIRLQKILIEKQSDRIKRLQTSLHDLRQQVQLYLDDSRAVLARPPIAPEPIPTRTDNRHATTRSKGIGVPSEATVIDLTNRSFFDANPPPTVVTKPNYPEEAVSEGTRSTARQCTTSARCTSVEVREPVAVTPSVRRVRQLGVEFRGIKAKYSGPVIPGPFGANEFLPHGIGVARFDNGDMYAGAFKGGSIHGIGSFYPRRQAGENGPSKPTQKGRFENNRFCGA